MTTQTKMKILPDREIIFREGELLFSIKNESKKEKTIKIEISERRLKEK